MASRKDNKGRVLQKGEYQRKDGRYHFAYTDVIGKRRYLYADNLVELWAKEKEYLIADWQGTSNYGTNHKQYNILKIVDETYDESTSHSLGFKECWYK